MFKRSLATAAVLAATTLGLAPAASASELVDADVKVNNVRVCNNDCVSDIDVL